MSESDFNRRIDDTLRAIEAALDAAGSDLDYENSGGILTLRCDNGTQLILNRQTPVRQLWLAARSGGFHFNWDAATEGWVRDSDGAGLRPLLEELLAAQCGESVAL
ncbi:MAG: iron donor protein CyaY [Pseudomonadota bacterium]